MRWNVRLLQSFSVLKPLLSYSRLQTHIQICLYPVSNWWKQPSPCPTFFFFYIDKFTIFFHSLQFSHFCRTRLGRIWNKFLKNKYRKENLAFLILIENHRTSWDIYRISPFSIKKYQDVIFGPYRPALDWGISGFSVCDPSIRL